MDDYEILKHGAARLGRAGQGLVRQGKVFYERKEKCIKLNVI